MKGRVLKDTETGGIHHQIPSYPFISAAQIREMQQRTKVCDRYFTANMNLLLNRTFEVGKAIEV